MMNGRRRIYFISYLLLAFCILSSCRKEVTNIKLPNTSKLVVGCFISPQDTLLTATITRSVPVFGSSAYTAYPYVWNANVRISDGVHSGTFLFNAIDSNYVLEAKQFPVLPGKTYTLNVSAPSGENVSASCTVPLNQVTSVGLNFVDTTSLVFGGSGLPAKKEIDMNWQDIPGQSNYYLAFAQEATYLYGDTIYNYIDSNGVSLFSNIGNNGSQFSIKFIWTDSSIPIFYDFYVMNISSEYYQYLNSIPNNVISNGDPFAVPNPVYTNITGGLGIFTAMQKLHVRKI
jgi:hypothetical protein